MALTNLALIQSQLPLPLKIVRHKRAKRISLRVQPRGGHIVLTLPRYSSLKQAEDFIVSQHEWLVKQAAKVPTTTEFQNGETIELLGEPVTILHQPDARAGVRIESNNLCVSGESEFMQRRISDFLVKYTKARFSEMTRSLAQHTGKTVRRISVRSMVSRWGSCSSRGDISLNWRLVFAPVFVAEYVVAHEVAHLTHLDHSADFWRLLHTLTPHTEAAKAWLNRYGNTLYRFG
jgi:predicted metal-dependent hydrolase